MNTLIGTHTVKMIPAAIYPEDFRTIATVTIKVDFSFFYVFQIIHIFCNELFVEVLVYTLSFGLASIMGCTTARSTLFQYTLVSAHSTF